MSSHGGGTEGLAWLLAILDSAVRLMDECGLDVDARILEAHRAELAAGREWPGMPITSATELDFERRRRKRLADPPAVVFGPCGDEPEPDATG